MAYEKVNVKSKIYFFTEGQWTLSNATLISLRFTSTMKRLGETGSCDCCMSIISNIIVAYDFEIEFLSEILN